MLQLLTILLGRAELKEKRISKKKGMAMPDDQDTFVAFCNRATGLHQSGTAPVSSWTGGTGGIGGNRGMQVPSYPGPIPASRLLPAKGPSLHDILAQTIGNQTK